MASLPILSRQDFESRIGDMNKEGKVIPNIPVVVSLASPVYIFSVCPHPFVIEFPGLGQYVIPACEKGKDVSAPLVLQGIIPLIHDRGEKELGLNLINGIDVACDLVGNRSGDVQLSEWTSNLEWKGVFICEDEQPSAEQIQKARSKRTQYLEFLVDAGNTQRTTEPTKKLQPYHYAAAIELNVKTNWAEKAKSQTSCPFCGTSCPDGVSICATCHQVIDPERYRATMSSMGMAPEPEPPKPVEAKQGEPEPTVKPEAGKPIYDRSKGQRS